MFPRAAVIVLILLLITIATVAVLAAVRLKRITDVAKCERVASDSSAFRTELETYREMNGWFPTTGQGLHALVEKPSTSPFPAAWQKLLGEIPPDPWGKPYIYRCPGIRHPAGYDLFSAGPDRKPDTSDDVWRE
jgi:general secretion pathway protein G